MFYFIQVQIFICKKNCPLRNIFSFSEIYVHSLRCLISLSLQHKCSSRKDKQCGINVWASYTNVTCVILQITFTNGYKLQPQPYFTAHHCINAAVWFCLGVSMERMSTSPFFSGPIDTELITMLFANMTIQMLRCYQHCPISLGGVRVTFTGSLEMRPEEPLSLLRLNT